MSGKVENLMIEAKPPQTISAVHKRAFMEFPIWQKAHQFTVSTYEFTRRFPADERKGLALQFRSSATEVASAMAELFATSNPSEKMKLLEKAAAILERCIYYIQLGRDLKYGEFPELVTLADETSALIHDYKKSVRNNLFLGL